MSVCGHCGIALPEGATVCGSCGRAVAPARAAGERIQWGTLQISRGRPAAAAEVPPLTAADAGFEPVNMQGEAASGAAAPEPRPQPTAAGGPARPARSAARPLSAPLTPEAAAALHPAARGASRPLTPEAAAGLHPAARGARPGTPDPSAVRAPRAPSRPLSAPLAPDARRARAPSRPLSAPLTPDAAAARHPAARGHGPATGTARAPSVPLAVPARGPQPSAARQAARSPSGAIAIDLPPAAAGEPANANHLDTGLLDLAMDDRFSGAQTGPALEMASVEPGPHEEPRAVRPQPRPQQQQPKPQPKPEAPRESPAEQRLRRLRDLARYQPAPPQWLAALPYAMRVYSRRRELEAQVSNLTQQRKRLELAHDEALTALGEALYAQRSDPSLQPIAAQIRVVTETAEDAGTKAAASKRTERELEAELATVTTELATAETNAEPVRAREAAVRQAFELHKTQFKRREMLARKADAELKAEEASPGPDAAQRIAALEAERDEHYGHMQALQAKVPPLQEELQVVLQNLAQHTARIDELQARQRRLLAARDREQGRGRITSGGMNAAYKDALRSLANAALRVELAGHAPDEQRAAAEAAERAAAHRESEELMRAAASCYDPQIYQRGMQILISCVIGTFVLFAALIAF